MTRPSGANVPRRVVAGIVVALKQGLPREVIAERYGVTQKTIRHYMRTGYVPPTSVPMIPPSDWQPACMTSQEWDEWRVLTPVYRKDTASIRKSESADRPCADCPLSFAREMRGEDRCNGVAAEEVA